METQTFTSTKTPSNGNSFRSIDTISSIQLDLHVTDGDSVEEIITKKAGRERDEYSLAALRVGLLSLKHARGQVDADAVRKEGERLLTELESTLTGYRNVLTANLGDALKEYFDPSTGRFQERVERLIKKDGELDEVLRRQVGAKGSELANSLAAHIGENSPLMRVIGPDQSNGLVAAIRSSAEQVVKEESERILGEFSLDNREGALFRLISELGEKNAVLEGSLTGTIQTAFAEFSLDKEDSILSRLVNKVERAQRTISEEFTLDRSDSALGKLRSEILGVMQEQNDRASTFQREVSVALESMKARRAESLRSTTHGNDFEDALVDFVQGHLGPIGDVVTTTGKRSGSVGKRKVGDLVVDLGPESIGAGERFVIEAKESGSYNLGKAREEIDTARKNRKAAVGLFVFSKRTAAETQDPLVRIGDDIFVVWDDQDISSDVVLKAGLSLAKALCIRDGAKRKSNSADLETVEKAILEIEREAKRLGEMRKCAESIRANSEKILKSVDNISSGLEAQVYQLRTTLLESV